MRHDHQRRVEAEDEPLQPVEAVEVEVVGRLVEQEDVEPGQQQGGELGAGGLAARQTGDLAVERRGGQAEVGGHRGDAGVEVGPAERHPAVEGGGVAVGGGACPRRPARRSPRRGWPRPRRPRCAGRASPARSRRGTGRALAAGSRRWRPAVPGARSRRRRGAGRPARAAGSTCPTRWARPARPGPRARARGRRRPARAGARRRRRGRARRVWRGRRTTALQGSRTGSGRWWGPCRYIAGHASGRRPTSLHRFPGGEGQHG